MTLHVTEKQLARLTGTKTATKARQKPTAPRTSAPAGMPRGWAAATDAGWSFSHSAIGNGRVNCTARHADGRTLGPFEDAVDGLDSALVAIGAEL